MTSFTACSYCKHYRSALIEDISVKDTAFFEVIWFSWLSKPIFHRFQEMFGGLQNYFIRSDMTFLKSHRSCFVKLSIIVTATALWGTDFTLYEQTNAEVPSPISYKWYYKTA